MSGIKEFRLANQFAQDANGVPRDPVSGSASADGVIPKTVLFSDLFVQASYSISASGQGYRVNEGGVAVEVNPASDPNTVIHVSVDDGANFIKMTPGVRLELPYRFERIYVKRSPNLPNTGQSFELDFFRTLRARLIAEPAAPGATQSGAAQFAVTRTTNVSQAGQNVSPARPNRTRVLIQNLGTGDLWVGTSAAVDATTGELLVAGDGRFWNVTGDIFARAVDATTSCNAREEYNA